MDQLTSHKENKVCFDCQAYSPDCVNMTALTFVCETCASHLKGFGQQIKSTHSSYFSPDEIHLLFCVGNAVAQDIWLHNWNKLTDPMPSMRNQADIQLFMRAKYIERKWFNQSKLDIILHQAQASNHRRSSISSIENDKSKKQFAQSNSNTKLPTPPVSSSDVYSWFRFSSKSSSASSEPSPTIKNKSASDLTANTCPGSPPITKKSTLSAFSTYLSRPSGYRDVGSTAEVLFDDTPL